MIRPSSPPSGSPRAGASALVLVVVFLSVMGAIQFAVNQMARNNRRSLRVLEGRFAALDLGERIFHRATSASALEAILGTAAQTQALKTLFESAPDHPEGGFSLAAFSGSIPASDLDIHLNDGESFSDLELTIPHYDYEIDPDGGSSTNVGTLNLATRVEVPTRDEKVAFDFHCELKFSFLAKYADDGTPLLRVRTYPGTETMVWQRE